MVSSHAARLGLPLALQRIHPVFHISLLQPASDSSIPNHIEDPPPPLNWTTQTNMKFRGFWIAKSTAAERARVLSTWWSGRVLITPRNQRVGNLRKTCGMPLILSGHSTDHTPISQNPPALLFIFFTHPVKTPSWSAHIRKQ